MVNLDQCAVNPNDTLKDASEITFYNSKGNDHPIPTHSVNNPTSFQDQTSCTARGAKSQQDNLAASNAVPACKVTGIHQRKLTWKLTKDENTTSTSTGSQKWKHPEEVLDNATPTNSHRQPTAQHAAIQMLSSFLTTRTTLSKTQAVNPQLIFATRKLITAVLSTNHSIVLSQNEATHQGLGNDDGKNHSDGKD
ncbi:hypothetical protein BDN67DRAFT_985467 [Paxillus ammoniavirescens]|nr:hypothetical protein BDN67DRAFT_985467 [Paxillus ammoniavirescens]